MVLRIKDAINISGAHLEDRARFLLTLCDFIQALFITCLWGAITNRLSSRQKTPLYFYSTPTPSRNFKNNFLGNLISKKIDELFGQVWLQEFIHHSLLEKSSTYWKLSEQNVPNTWFHNQLELNYSRNYHNTLNKLMAGRDNLKMNHLTCP